MDVKFELLTAKKEGDKFRIIGTIYSDELDSDEHTVLRASMFTIEKDKENKEHFYVYRLADMVENIHKYEEDEYNKEHAHDHEEFKIVNTSRGILGYFRSPIWINLL